ncbi:MAG: MarR family transcriptional regulator [Rhodospirillaceae bacterium]|nr:MarR family transcriptional regulator [Magnetovibrio sp.]MAY66800.1 MarR family transcriptional regulator [Rhodospirillaceae bacterium]
MSRTYSELTRLIERLHRRFLDVIRAELNRLGVRDLNGVQALLLANIGDEAMAIRDLVERGYYQGSNVSYNIKKLTDMGYLTQERSQHDKRSITVQLTDKARAVVKQVKALEDHNATAFSEYIDEPKVEEVCQALQRLERTWADYIHYGGE